MFGRRRKIDDFSAEIEAHLKLEAERLREQGLSEEEARAAAYRAFGNVTKAQGRFYESRRWLWCDHFSQDVRYGLRQISRLHVRCCPHPRPRHRRQHPPLQHPRRGPYCGPCPTRTRRAWYEPRSASRLIMEVPG
jgi:hypothetical protein